MEAVRQIYDKARAEFMDLLARLQDEMKDVMLVLDADICSSNGDTLTIEELEEIREELNIRKREIEYDISFVKAQIAFVDSI